VSRRLPTGARAAGRYTRPATAEQRQDKLAALHDRLIEQVRAPRTGEDWQRWLEMAVRATGDEPTQWREFLIVGGIIAVGTAVVVLEKLEAGGGGTGEIG